MPVFISYSHANAEFAEKLAFQLVNARAQVWIDRWELNVGDSLLRRIEEAVTGASALVVVLSQSSVSSEWCRKELTAGLVRELEEKRVVVMPVLLENCDVPLFLRDKKYADFRTDFDSGLSDLLKGVSRVTNDTRSHIETPDWHTDWAIDWGLEDGRAFYTLTFVEQAVAKPYSCLVVLRIRGNDHATARYQVYHREGMGLGLSTCHA
jgi:TIR domain